MLARSGALDCVLPGNSPYAAADHTILAGDLPHLLAPPELPPPLALSPLPERVAAARRAPASLGPPPYIGLTWRAGTGPQEQRGHVWFLFKQAPLENFAAALGGVKATLVSLQRRPQAGETEKLGALLGTTVHDLSAANEDLEEMLALLAVMDEYIGVSNTNMHLRAGIGKTARVLLPWPAEWRWMAAGDCLAVVPGIPGLPPATEWRLERGADAAARRPCRSGAMKASTVRRIFSRVARTSASSPTPSRSSAATAGREYLSGRG